MAALVLTGCRTTPLSGYLAALGLHRAVHRLLDTGAAGRWDHGTYVLRSRFATISDLAQELAAKFVPESIVSPWNSGAGFKTVGKRSTANNTINKVRASDDPRLAPLRRTIESVDRALDTCRRLGIDPWDKKQKHRVIQVCRNEFPDHAVAWLDAVATVVDGKKATMSALLGSAGNLGRQELSANYLAQALIVLKHRDTVAWLTSALDGQQRARFPKGSPGQFDPGGASGPDEPRPVANPWTFLFLVEATLLFAGRVVRRYGAEYSGAAWPFQVTASTAGFASSAQGERPRAELWAPEWSEYLSLPQVEHLLVEGRVRWHSRTARSGLDMARAAATFGVDRGIDAFQRHVFVERHGQSMLAVPAGRVEVGARGGVDLLAPLDPWRNALNLPDPPSDLATRLRALDQAVFEHARTGGSCELAGVFAALGRCRSAASRSGKVHKANPPRLAFPYGAKLLDRLRAAAGDDRELRIALALISSRDGDRDNDDVYAAWLKQPYLPAGLASGLADIARRRGFPLATAEVVTGRVPAVRGARLAFTRGLRLHSADVLAFVEGTVDYERTAALILGLACVEWRHTPDETLPGKLATPDPIVDLLLPFMSPWPLTYTSADGEQCSLFVRPGHDWPGRLISGHVADVLNDATRRLRIAGLRHVVSVRGASHDGTRLAAALMLATTAFDRRAALGRVAVVEHHQVTPTTQEVPT
ncbi:type I-U CRISPR-associated protein Csx17 [Mycobacterium canetti]|uniref:type I-G CRISPR-associated protein Cas8g1/Csx17 n=1 Tax=Mycobacterium canetti TaxID=78331 RepID=UPI0002A550AE|nr:type I-U CRISPR-associated protein Csx17 [Mycobacterium canetti]CCK64990.1 Conserved CRISPR-associated protein of unknown function Csx17 [Mycobacterium canettii CIPT 140070017]